MKLLNDDCIKVMAKMPDEVVDCIITDPPYLMDYQSNFRKKKQFSQGKGIAGDNKENDEQLIKDYFKECHRILKNNTHIYSFCSWHQINFFKQEFEKHFDLKNILIWHKPGGGIGDLTGSYIVDNEFILFGHKGRRNLTGKRIGSVQKVGKVNPNAMVHPTEKPVELIKTIEAGETVFDGFMGSGSTGVACKELDRNFIGVELNEEYYNISCDRIKTKGLGEFFL